MTKSVFDHHDDGEEKTSSWTEGYIFNMFNKFIMEERIREKMCSLILLLSTLQNTLLLYAASYSFIQKKMTISELRGEYLVLKGFRKLSFLASPLDILEQMGLENLKNALFFVLISIGYIFLAFLITLSVVVTCCFIDREETQTQRKI